MSHRDAENNYRLPLDISLSRDDLDALRSFHGWDNQIPISSTVIREILFGMIDDGFNRLAKPEPLWEGEPDPEPLPDDPFADEEEEPEHRNQTRNPAFAGLTTGDLIAELRRRGKDNFEHWANGPLFPSNPDEEEEEESAGGPWIVLRGDNEDNLTIAAAHFTDKRDADRELTALAGQGIPAKMLTFSKNGLYT